MVIVKKSKESALDFKIILLQNAVYYSLQCVFMKKTLESENYRLIVIHNNRLQYDQTYPSQRGAKIAFTKLFGKKRWKTGGTEWTDSYTPESEWWEEKQQIVEKGKND